MMPNRQVRDQWRYPRTMERHLPIKPGQPIGMVLPLIVLFPNFLIRANNRFVKSGTANFGRSIPTEISGPPAEVIPNIPVGRNRHGPFHLNSDRTFRNLWQTRKHSMSSRSSVDRAPARCWGGHGFYSCRELRFFLCLILVACYLVSK